MATKYQPAADAGSPEEHRSNLRQILEDAGTVMLITRNREGGLHTRPMAVARVDDDGTMYFATSLDSMKVGEIRTDPRVDVVFQSKTQYATVSGTARMRHDRALIDELWSESWKLWFSRGKQDPDLVILVVDPDRGEYWDQSGVRGISFLYRVAKAYVTGEKIESKPEDHGKVRL